MEPKRPSPEITPQQRIQWLRQDLSFIRQTAYDCKALLDKSGVELMPEYATNEVMKRLVELQESVGRSFSWVYGLNKALESPEEAVANPQL